MSKMIANISLLILMVVLISIIGPLALAATPVQQSDQTVVDVIIEDGRFSILTMALQQASLVGTLRGDGPFTIFAPTDDAFRAIPTETLNNLLADPAALRDILLYLVVPNQLLAADLANLATIDTALGQPLIITLDANVVRVNNAQLIVTDIEAANGVIHVIDAVLMPTSGGETPLVDEPPTDGDAKDIVDVIIEDGRFTTLIDALQAADLIDTLKGVGPFTVFAPTNDAFAALPEGTLDGLLADGPRLRNVLLYHLLRGAVPAEDIVKLSAADTVLGPPVSISVEGNSLKINEAQVTVTNIRATNGIIHVIDAVLLPPENPQPQPDPNYDRPPAYHNPHPYNNPYNNYERNCCDNNYNNYGRNCCGTNNDGYNYKWGSGYPGYGNPYSGGYYGGRGYRYSYYSYYPYRYKYW